MILLPGEFLPRQEIPLWADGPKEFWAEREVLKDPRVNHWDEGLSPWQRRFYQIFDKGWFNAMCFKWGEALTVYLCNLKCTKPSMAFVQTVGTPLRTLAKAPDPIGAAARRQLSRGVHGLAEYETEVWLPWVKRTCRCSLHEVVMWLWRLSWSCKLYGYNVCSGETKKNKGKSFHEQVLNEIWALHNIYTQKTKYRNVWIVPVYKKWLVAQRKIRARLKKGG